MSRTRRCVAAAVLALAATSSPAADLGRGAQVYGRHCAKCHGTSGMSLWPGAPNLARREGLMQPDGAIAAALRKGRGTKVGYQGVLSDADILNVIAYARTLAR
jgi:mono/diheme cytochrome c family protein